MDIEHEAAMQHIISDDFDTMKEMLDHIRERIGQHPTTNQRDFYLPIRDMIYEAWQDSLNDKDSFLNKPTTND